MVVTPPFLQKGDLVAITAPASVVNPESLKIGKAILENNWGLKLLVGDTVGAKDFNYSGTEQLRQAEFQSFLDHPEVKLILAARGGYGSSKFLDNLSFRKFKKNPKWVCGFSDLTAILLELNKLNIKSIHGPMAKTMSFDDESNDYLYQILFGLKPEFTFSTSEYNQLGEVEAEAIGGNLVIITHSLGSKSDVRFDNKILFLEDIGEYFYNIDRMFVQLKRAGKLSKLAGIVIGNFSDCKENSAAFGKCIEEIVLEHCATFGYPIAFNFPFGHENANFPIVIGGTYKLSINQNNSNLKLL